MPKFTTKVIVTNKGDASVSAHVGASLVGASDRGIFQYIGRRQRYFSDWEDHNYKIPNH